MHEAAQHNHSDGVEYKKERIDYSYEGGIEVELLFGIGFDTKRREHTRAKLSKRKNTSPLARACDGTSGHGVVVVCAWWAALVPISVRVVRHRRFGRCWRVTTRKHVSGALRGVVLHGTLRHARLRRAKWPFVATH